MEYKTQPSLNCSGIFAFTGFYPVFAGGGEYQTFVAEKDSKTQQKVVCCEVFGMDCPGCQSALEKQVKKIDGVADAKANFK